MSCNSLKKIVPDKNQIERIPDYTKFDINKYNKAIDKITRKIKRDTLSSEAFYVRGFCYLRINKNAEALQDFDKSIKISPSFYAYICRIQTNRKLKKYREAYEDLKKAEALDSTNIILDHEYGCFFLDVKDYKKAITYFKKIVQYKGLNSSTFYNMGLCEFYLKNYEKSIEYYNAAKTLNPNNPPLYDLLGTSYIYLDDYQKGIENYTIAIKQDSNFYLPYYNRGRTYFKYEKFNEAIIDFQIAEKLTNEKEILITVYCNLSRLMLLNRKYNESINYGKKVISYNDSIGQIPFYYIAKYNMAISYLKLSETEKANKLYLDCFNNANFAKDKPYVNEIIDDLIGHYKTGVDQETVKEILLNTVNISEEEFNNRLKVNDEIRLPTAAKPNQGLICR